MTRSPDRSGTLDVDGASLYYEEFGRGTPVVLLHAFALDRRMWDDQVEALADRYRLVRYDLRGFGRSAPPTGPYRHVDDLIALLDCLGIARAFFIGLSMGGGAAINAAVEYPERVLGLVVVDPSLGGFTWSRAQKTAMAAIRDRAGHGGVEQARRRWLSLPIFRTLAAHPEANARFTSMVADYSGWHWKNAECGLPIAPPAIERLHDIQAPTLVIVGERDTADFQQIAATLEAGIPRVRKAVVPGVGHLVNMEAPGPFNALVSEFLAEHRFE